MAQWLEVPVLAQRDPRWASTLMGTSPDSTIGQYGCLITDFAMLAGVTPLEMNSRMRNMGGYQAGGGCPACAATFDVQRFVASAPPMIDATASYPFTPFPVAITTRLVNHLKSGAPAIIEVDSQPNTPGHQSHFVLAVSAFGVGAQAQVVIDDPWYGDQTLIEPRYGVGGLGRVLVRAVFYGRTA